MYLILISFQVAWLNLLSDSDFNQSDEKTMGLAGKFLLNHFLFNLLSGNVLLTRSLAYKGPVDHLSQLFSLELLYRAMHALLDDLLIDWQYSADEELIKAVFLHQGELVKTQLDWPLKGTGNSFYCSCNLYYADNSVNNHQSGAEGSSSSVNYSQCLHLAALAIESKMRLERLPHPVRQDSGFTQETDYLQNWISQQNFDPFPNMARHRVIYLLDGEESAFTLTIHKAYLSTHNEYQKKADLPINLPDKGNLPKFISLTDQEIIYQISLLLKSQPQLAMGENGITLQMPLCESLLQMMVDSERCFWRSCHRHPLTQDIATQIDKSWCSITENLLLDGNHSRIIRINKVCTPGVGALINCDDFSNMTMQPCLEISSEQLHFPWYQNKKSKGIRFQFDVARVYFQIGAVQLNYSESLWLEKSNPVFAHQFQQKIASAIHQLDSMPGVYASFEAPISRQFDKVDRILFDDLSHWFILFNGLYQEHWKIIFKPAFRLNQKKIDNWYSKVSTHNSDSSNHWFDLEIGVNAGNHSINILPYVVEAIKQGGWHENLPAQNLAITLDDGSQINISHERIKQIVENLVELFEKNPLSEKQGLTLPLSRLSGALDVAQNNDDKIFWENSQWLKQKLERLQNYNNISQVKVPHNVHASLREYQQAGVSWLQFIYAEQFNGILADDMGLGKTLQALTHIQIEKNKGHLTTPCLIVAPTSLLGNWVSESRRFTPTLKVTRWSGTKRKQAQQKLAQSDIIITSYGLLLRDHDLLNKLNLFMIILDEAQTIKNAKSQVSKIACSMKSQHRLCLTGTPLENHLGELWSLFNFLMPGFLGSERQFNRAFRWPVEKEGDAIRQKVLVQRIAPFLLRRNKINVASDLPSKTIIEEYIELSESQSVLYESVRLSMFEEVQKAIMNTEKTRNHLMISNALLRLRQICCHPELVEKALHKQESIKDSQSDSPEFTSSKLMWLQTKLPEMLDSRQRILIFSSFTSMLDLIAKLLESLQIDYLMLTGKTRKRSALVKSFQEGCAPVFLISLKAGGAGLNLTKADTVIHFDPWWNPAAENQASDRAHRIGQEKPVFIYKLLTAGTVEERIHLMQQQKYKLADELYQKHASMSMLEQIDWKVLLSPIKEEIR